MPTNLVRGHGFYALPVMEGKSLFARLQTPRANDGEGMSRRHTWPGYSSRPRVALLTLAACQPPGEGMNDADETASLERAAATWPKVTSAIARDAGREARVDSLLKSMTLEEKVGQMIQVEIQEVTPAEIKQYPLGSVLNGGGSYPGQNKAATVQDSMSLPHPFTA